MILLQITVILMLLLIIGLLVEKMLHQEYSLTQLTQSLKKDVTSVLQVLFSKEEIRHNVDVCLYEELRKAVFPFTEETFEIDVVQASNGGTPCVGISLVPKQDISAEDINRLTQLALLKFRKYLWTRDLKWKNFGCYAIMGQFIYVYLYYSEFDRDWENFSYRYKVSIKEKQNIEFGVLKDDALDKELENVM